MLIKESHGKNVLNLVIVNGYLKKFLDNARVMRFLSQNHPEILTEFQKLSEAAIFKTPREIDCCGDLYYWMKSVSP